MKVEKYILEVIKTARHLATFSQVKILSKRAEILLESIPHYRTGPNGAF